MIFSFTHNVLFISLALLKGGLMITILIINLILGLEAC